MKNGYTQNAIKKQKSELEKRCNRELKSSMQELVNYIEKF